MTAEERERPGAAVEAIPLDAGGVEALRTEWEAFESGAAMNPYLTFGWLASWAEVYAQRRLLFVRVTVSGGTVAALGLLEQLPMRRLRFAGAPVTPVRGLLSRPELDGAAWQAFVDWLRQRSGWNWVDGQGVALPVVPPAPIVSTLEPWFAIDLPETFEEYLSARPGPRRRELRRRMRVAKASGAEFKVQTTGLAEPLDLFVRFHTERALSKGEVHAAIDGRLSTMLCRVIEEQAPAVRVYTLVQGDEMVAVAINLESGDRNWAYNTGFASHAARISPGLVLRLDSIRDAIERGSRRFDLGPGDFAYKGELGAELYGRSRIELSGRSPAAQCMRAAALSRRRLRDVDWMRSAVARIRNARALRIARD
jgi:CelD/BcsL family acetyltransferase involved in cellulose biosynthesis